MYLQALRHMQGVHGYFDNGIPFEVCLTYFTYPMMNSTMSQWSLYVQN
jgi:hypothetical protein